VTTPKGRQAGAGSPTRAEDRHADATLRAEWSPGQPPRRPHIDIPTNCGRPFPCERSHRVSEVSQPQAGLRCWHGPLAWAGGGPPPSGKSPDPRASRDSRHTGAKPRANKQKRPARRGRQAGRVQSALAEQWWYRLPPGQEKAEWPARRGSAAGREQADDKQEAGAIRKGRRERALGRSLPQFSRPARSAAPAPLRHSPAPRLAGQTFMSMVLCPVSRSDKRNAVCSVSLLGSRVGVKRESAAPARKRLAEGTAAGYVALENPLW
jgi:hypothetical protein